MKKHPPSCSSAFMSNTPERTGLFPLQCSHLLSPRAMSWLHGRARTLAENVLTLSAGGGRWGWLPPWASQDPRGKVRGLELQPEGPSHPAGTWSTSLPSCCPDQNCCPPPPIAWWLEGKNPFVKVARHVCPGGPALHHAPKSKKTKEKDNRMSAFLRPGYTRATSSGTGPRRRACPEQSDTSSQAPATPPARRNGVTLSDEVTFSLGFDRHTFDLVRGTLKGQRSQSQSPWCQPQLHAS